MSVTGSSHNIRAQVSEELAPGVTDSPKVCHGPANTSCLKSKPLDTPNTSTKWVAYQEKKKLFTTCTGSKKTKQRCLSFWKVAVGFFHTAGFLFIFFSALQLNVISTTEISMSTKSNENMRSQITQNEPAHFSCNFKGVSNQGTNIQKQTNTGFFVLFWSIPMPDCCHFTIRTIILRGAFLFHLDFCTPAAFIH